MMHTQSHYLVLIPEKIHLGNKPFAGITFVGPTYHATFELPDSLVPDEPALVQCRTLHIQIGNKKFLLNGNKVKNFLDPHPGHTHEWFMESMVVPGGSLKQGANNLEIGFTDEKYDDFLLDALVIWYKTCEAGG
jgi:hypothetical protein